jgi:hypothetical protein
MSRCYGCGTELTWDDTVKSASGKKIPLETDGSPHRCPNRPAYNSVHKVEEGGLSIGVTVERVAKSQDEIKVALLQLLEIVQILQTKLEMMDGSRKEGSVKVEQS